MDEDMQAAIAKSYNAQSQKPVMRKSMSTMVNIDLNNYQLNS